MAEANFLEAPGEVIRSGELKAQEARNLHRTLEAGLQDYCWLRECRRFEMPGEEGQTADVVVFDVEVEVGQRSVHDVRRLERIAALFRQDDSALPEVFALRDDFPLVPHLNALSPLRTEFPRNLCMYDEPYFEVELNWTPAAFLKRIREWLARTARGELHAEDQPLEPLLVASPWSIMLPPDLFEREEDGTLQIAVQGYVEDGLENRLLVTEWLDETHLDEKSLPCAVVTVEGSAQEHGIIRRIPFNLEELREFLEDAEIDLYAKLREQLGSWYEHHEVEKLRGNRVIIVASLPKVREAGGVVEASDVWAFEIAETLDELGERFDLWQKDKQSGARGVVLEPSPDVAGSEISLAPLNVCYAFSREMAAAQSVGKDPDARKVVGIGAGALGSQFFLNAVRQGWGEWTLIDHDRLLPHNLARHALPGLYVGRSKVDSLAHLANETVWGGWVASPVVANVLAPGKRDEEVEQALHEADIVLDTSASVAVERYLARDAQSSARRVSIFLNPSGTDGVMLCEDEERRCPLDWLEMRYYREIATRPELQKHMKPAQGQLRYARSCGDVSSVLAQDLVALHAATGVRACRSALEAGGSSILLWRTSETSVGIEHAEIEPYPALEHRVGDWTVVTDRWLMDKVVRERAEKLPNETGGVLIGARDMKRRIVYVVKSLSSPPDSTEWPTVYIRGKQGLRRRIQEIRHITGDHLGYVGEWHSHPRGHSPSPSSDDRRAFEWLSDILASEGLPATMLIVGESDSAWHVGRMT